MVIKGGQILDTEYDPQFTDRNPRPLSAEYLRRFSGDEDTDPMLVKALEIIRTTKRASTSNLQRKLRIGYNRAARIMDEFEERGIVGPDNGAQPREILKDFNA